MAFNKGTPEERFWQKVDRSGDGCWNWLATITPRGYGYFYSVPGATHGAHRFSYELAFGPIPAGLMVCHHCDNRICVRPDHLFLGTAKDNAADMMAKGRQRYVTHTGMDHGRARLTDQDVLAIRAVFTGRYGQTSELARRFGVDRRSITRAVAGKTWKHLLAEATS